MSKSRSLVRFLGLAFVIALLLTLVVSGAGAQEGKVLVTGLNMVAGDPDNGLDPALSSTIQSITILEQLYVGLSRLDEETVEVEPGISTWEFDEASRTFTFSIYPEISWVRWNGEAVEQVTDESGNVRYVTANDFYYGIMRTLNPETASDYAYVLAPVIEGGNAYNSGEAGPEAVQVTVVDDLTLQITTVDTAAFNINILGLWMAFAQPQWAIDEFGDTWVEAENRQSYGPFVMSEWNHDSDITIVRNPFWAGTENIPAPALDAVVFRLIDDAAQFAEYQAGTMQAATVPSPEIERVKADATLSEEYYAGFESCSVYYGFNVEKEPFTNVNIRRAFSLAVDRESLMNDVTRDGRLPATFFTRPGVVAGPTPETNADLGVSFDPEGAQAALEAGLAELGLGSIDELPEITLAYGDTEYNGLIAQAVQAMWEETLGITVTLQPLDTTTYYDVQQEDAAQIHRAGWCYDYPDANSYLYDVFRTGASANYPNFSNEEFDSLVNEARTLSDPAERLALYVRAEQILVEEVAAIAPLYWHTTRQIVAPNVVRTFSQIGFERLENWDIQ
ncbi:MAG: peptide ABC transporter substrate-binding protein [bacterium]|nr:peptide ABC transporter substrate-binding protein [bacterium]